MVSISMAYDFVISMLQYVIHENIILFFSSFFFFEKKNKKVNNHNIIFDVAYTLYIDVTYIKRTIESFYQKNTEFPPLILLNNMCSSSLEKYSYIFKSYIIIFLLFVNLSKQNSLKFWMKIKT